MSHINKKNPSRNNNKSLILFLVPTVDSNNDESSKIAFAHSTINDILQCSVCLGRLHDPRALPCQHVYCFSCLKRILSSNRRGSKIICPKCNCKYPWNSFDQFPKSYTHNQLLDLIPKNYDIEGKCLKCKEKTILNLCPCCDYHLCKTCTENDRKSLLNHIENLVHKCYDNGDYIQTITSIDINNLLSNANELLKNSDTIEFKDMLPIFYDLNYYYQQVNKLPVTYANQTQEISMDIDPLNLQSSMHLNQQEQINNDNDDDIIYIKTIHNQSPLVIDD